MPSRRRTSPSASPSGAGSRARTCPARLDQGHLPAQAAHGLGHLGADGSAAEYQQPPRDGLHAGHLAVGPDAIELAQARDGRHDRIGAGRHDHMPGGVTHAVDLHHARPGQPAGPAQQVDALARQPALLPGIGVVGDHEVAPGQRRLDVDLRAGPRLARGLHRLAGAQQRLGRDARPVGALTPDQLALDQGDPQAALGQRPGAVLARRAAAHDDDVVVGVHVLAPCAAAGVQSLGQIGRGIIGRWHGSHRPGRRVVISWSSLAHVGNGYHRDLELVVHDGNSSPVDAGGLGCSCH